MRRIQVTATVLIASAGTNRTTAGVSARQSPRGTPLMALPVFREPLGPFTGRAPVQRPPRRRARLSLTRTSLKRRPSVIRLMPAAAAAAAAAPCRACRSNPGSPDSAAVQMQRQRLPITEQQCHTHARPVPPVVRVGSTMPRRWSRSWPHGRMNNNWKWPHGRMNNNRTRRNNDRAASCI